MKFSEVGHILGILLVAACMSHGAYAQSILPNDPARIKGGADQHRNREPAFPEAVPALVLPPVAPLPESNKISSQFRVFVKEYRFVGNTVFSQEELERFAVPYTGRMVTSDDLEELRHKLTLYYVSKGYINSGALLPDQEVKDHAVTFRIVEGTLNAVNVTGTQKLKVDYVRDRILIGAGPPLNVNKLQERLRVLQQNGLIEKINADLTPGKQQGTSALNVAVQEARPYQVGLTFDNHISPSVGPYHTTLYATHRDLSGRGDSVEATYGTTRGINDYSLRYALPIDAHDTTIGIQYSKNDFAVIEAPFNQLNIRSHSLTKALSVERPIIQTPAHTLTLGLSLERRSSQSFLLGQPFSFSAGIPNGTSADDVLRFSQEWNDRDVNKVFTLRSTFAAGTTNAMPKVNNVGPDKHFVTWLGQTQWARRMEGGSQFTFLANLQYTRQSLLTLEKLGIGGANTVRGYRETQLLRDNGYIVSGEYRRPIFLDQTGGSRTQLACFFDYGYGWNTDQSPDVPRDIASAGLGLLWNPNKYWQAQIYAAKAFRNFTNTGARDLQDRGIHFLLNYQFF